MEIKQALVVLEQALNAANKAGVFTLQDSATVQVALNTVRASFEAEVKDEVKPVKQK